MMRRSTTGRRKPPEHTWFTDQAIAALGAKIEVPTLDGRSLLRIPPGTNSGQKLRLRDKGIPSLRQPGSRGHQYVELQVIVPKPVDERVRELLRELDRLAPEDPRKDLFERTKA